MNFRKTIVLCISLTLIAALVACSSTNNTPVAVTPSTNSATQSATVNTAFTYALSVTVTNNGNNPVSGVPVTFTAPTAGSGVATGTFATGVTTDVETTNSSGVATASQTFTAGTVAGTYPVQAVAGTATATFTLSNTSGAPATMVASSPASGTEYGIAGGVYVPLEVLVSDTYGNTVSGASVTFTVTAGGGGATAAFATGGTTDTETTGSNGIATTSQAFTANGTTGPFTVAASSAGLTPVSFSLTNVTAPVGAGNYAFSLTGEDANGPYYVAGVFTVTASDTITGGEQDFRDPANTGTQDLINAASSYFTVTADGNLQIVLTTCSGSTCTSTDGNVGVGGVETINGTLRPTDSTRGAITEFDGSAAAIGDFRQQDPTAASTLPSQGYAFVVGGLDGGEQSAGSATFNPVSMGGVIDVDGTANGTGTISGTGSIFDANDNLTPFPNETLQASTGTVSAPDSFGRVVYSITPTDGTNFPQISWVGYIANSSITYLVETADSFGGTTGGVARSQGANTGNFGASVAGSTYGVAMSGMDTLGHLQLVTELAFGAPSAGATGYMDFNDLSTQEPASPDPVSAASYTADAYGRVMLTISDGATTANTYNLNLYLDGNGDALAISLDTTDTLGSVIGSSLTNTGTDASFNGNYAGTFFGLDAASGEFFSAVGPIAATGGGDTFSGFTDFNFLGATTADAQLTGSYAYVGYNGILSPVGITGLDVDSSFANTDNFNMYEIDTSGDGVLIETDVNQLTLGFVQQ